MLLLHLLPACADAGSDLCTLCPDLCTLCLWCYPSINQRSYSTCTHGAGHWLQLALVRFSFSHWHLAPVVVSPVATCAGGLFPSTHWRTYSTCVRATCTVWYILYNNVFGRANVTIPSRYASRTVNTAFTTEDCILVGLINLFSEVQDQDCLNYFLFLGCLATYAPCCGFMTL